MSLRLVLCLSVFSLGLSSCGGGGSDSEGSPPPPLPPAADIAPPTVSFSPTALETRSSVDLDIVVTVDDPSGVSSDISLICEQGATEIATTVNGNAASVDVAYVPPIVVEDVIDMCTLMFADTVGNSASQTFDIAVSPAPVRTEDFNGTWFGPCYNNILDFSLQQTLNISDGSVETEIDSYTAADNGIALECVLPEGGALLETETDTRFEFGKEVTVEGCLNRRGVETTVTVNSAVLTSDPDAAVASTPVEVRELLNSVTGFADVLPEQTTMCLLDNGNLLFAGVEYTRDFNTVSVNAVDLIRSPELEATAGSTKWRLDEFFYSNAGIEERGTQEAAAAVTPLSNIDTANLNILLVTDSDSEILNGDYSSSQVTVTYNAQGPGLYRLLTQGDLLEATIPARQQDTLFTDKVLSLSTLVGISTPGAARYDADETSGLVLVLVDDGGNYRFFTISPLVLNLNDVLVNAGEVIDGAPEKALFRMENIYDFDGPDIP